MSLAGIAALLLVLLPLEGTSWQGPDRKTLQAAVDAFRATDLDGREISSAGLRGRVVLFEFWATWCAPCLSDIPWLQKATRAYKGTFEVVGISIDVIDRAEFTSWLRRHGIEWPQVHDRRGWASPVVTPFGFDRIPFNVLVDADGRVVGTNVREEKLMRTLEALLGRPDRVGGISTRRRLGLRPENCASGACLTLPRRLGFAALR